MINLKKYLFNNSNKVKINSKDISKGDVFIALSGEKNHGNQYISEAVSNGAKYIVTSKLPKNLNKNNIVIVKNTLKFLENVAKEKRQKYKGTIVGVTGSIGKTSVKENLNYFLSKYFNVSASIKSYNNYLGVVISLLNLNLKSKFSIFEIGTNNFNEIKKLSSIVQPSQVIITNIFPTHLEKLINTKNIAKEKSDIFNLKYNPNVELAILSNNNVDEEYIIKKAIKYKNFKVMSFGKNKTSNMQIHKIENIDNNYSKIFIRYNLRSFDFIITNSHLHKINNILICLLFFIFNKINLNILLDSIKDIPLLEGRGLISKIKINDKIFNLIDESYNASPQTMKVSIDYFNDINIKNNQKRIMILGEMKELGNNSIKFHIDLLEYLSKKNFDHVIICGDLMQIALKKTNNTKILFMKNVELIIEYINKIICNEDIILIKGSNSSLTNELAKKLLNYGEN